MILPLSAFNDIVPFCAVKTESSSISPPEVFSAKILPFDVVKSLRFTLLCPEELFVTVISSAARTLSSTISPEALSSALITTDPPCAFTLLRFIPFAPLFATEISPDAEFI